MISVYLPAKKGLPTAAHSYHDALKVKLVQDGCYQAFPLDRVLCLTSEEFIFISSKSFCLFGDSRLIFMLFLLQADYKDGSFITC